AVGNSKLIICLENLAATGDLNCGCDQGQQRAEEILIKLHVAICSLVTTSVVFGQFLPRSRCHSMKAVFLTNDKWYENTGLYCLGVGELQRRFTEKLSE